jgi:hypothetical protein
MAATGSDELGAAWQAAQSALTAPAVMPDRVSSARTRSGARDQLVHVRAPDLRCAFTVTGRHDLGVTHH